MLNPQTAQGLIAPEEAPRPRQAAYTKAEAKQLLRDAHAEPVVLESMFGVENPQEQQDGEEATERELRLQELALDFFTMKTLFGFVKELCETFGKVEVIESYGNYMRLRVDKQDKSIGFLFKLAEELKEKHDISEYSAHQTTLEQIF